MRRVLGLDVGDRRIGIALSDELGITAQGLMVLERQNLQVDLHALQQLIARHAIDTIVVGMPRNMNGSYGLQAEKTARFLQRLQQACKIPCMPWDERLTTQQAERLLLEGQQRRHKRQAVRDKIAAQLVLQNYLDYQRLAPARPPT